MIIDIFVLRNMKYDEMPRNLLGTIKYIVRARVRVRVIVED